MDAHQKQMNKDNYNTYGFIEKLKKRIDPLPASKKINSFSLAEEMSQISRKPYSTRNRSIQHAALRPESITEALKGSKSPRKLSKDRFNLLDNKQLFISQAQSEDDNPLTQRATNAPYRTKLKEELLNTSQAASVYYGPAAKNPLPPHGPKVPGKNVNPKRPPKLHAEQFAQVSSTKRLSPERKQFSKLSSIESSNPHHKKAKSLHPGVANPQFYQTAIVQESGQPWIEKKFADSASSDYNLNPVEQSIMFDSNMNKTATKFSKNLTSIASFGKTSASGWDQTAFAPSSTKQNMS